MAHVKAAESCVMMVTHVRIILVQLIILRSIDMASSEI